VEVEVGEGAVGDGLAGPVMEGEGVLPVAADADGEGVAGGGEAAGFGEGVAVTLLVGDDVGFAVGVHVGEGNGVGVRVTNARGQPPGGAGTRSCGLAMWLCAAGSSGPVNTRRWYVPVRGA